MQILPAVELQSLRTAKTELVARRLEDEVELVKRAGADGLELQLQIEPRRAGLIELAFKNEFDERTVLRIDPSRRRYELDRTASGNVAFDEHFAGIQTAPMPSSGTQSLKVFIDTSSIEVFINEGTTVLTSLVFPRVRYDRVTLKADPTDSAAAFGRLRAALDMEYRRRAAVTQASLPRSGASLPSSAIPGPMRSPTFP